MGTVGINSSHGSRLRQNIFFRALCPKKVVGMNVAVIIHIYSRREFVSGRAKAATKTQEEEIKSFSYPKQKLVLQLKISQKHSDHNSYRTTSISDSETQVCVLLMENRIYFFPFEI